MSRIVLRLAIVLFAALPAIRVDAASLAQQAQAAKRQQEALELLRQYMQQLITIRQGQAKSPAEQAQAQAAVEAAGRRLVSARAAAVEAQQQMNQIGQTVEFSQPAGSPLMTAKGAIRDARLARDKAVAQLKAAASGKIAPTQIDVSQPRDQFGQMRIEDPAIAQAELKMARTKYEAVLRDLCQADPRWVAARQKLNAAHHEEMAAEKELYDKRLDKLCTGGRIPGAAIR